MLCLSGVTCADATFTSEILTPETALKAAQAALKSCRDRGYQATVAVVDRMGVAQVLLRDRFAGPHTPDMATAKACTAASFRTSTTELAEAPQPGRPASGIRHRPGVAAVGGGLMIEAGGSLLGRSASPARPAGARTMPAPRRASPRSARISSSRGRAPGTELPWQKRRRRERGGAAPDTWNSYFTALSSSHMVWSASVLGVLVRRRVALGARFGQAALRRNGARALGLVRARRKRCRLLIMMRFMEYRR